MVMRLVSRSERAAAGEGVSGSPTRVPVGAVVRGCRYPVAMTTHTVAAGESLASIAAGIEAGMREQVAAAADAARAGGGDGERMWRQLAAAPLFGTEEFEEKFEEALWRELVAACGGDENAARRTELEPGTVLKVPVLCGHPVLQRNDRGRQPELCAKEAKGRAARDPELECPLCQDDPGSDSPHTSRRATDRRNALKTNPAADTRDKSGVEDTAHTAPATQPQPAPAAQAPAQPVAPAASRPGSATATDAVADTGSAAAATPTSDTGPATPAAPATPATAPTPTAAAPAASAPVVAAATAAPASGPAVAAGGDAGPAAVAGSRVLSADLAAIARQVAEAEAARAREAEAERAKHAAALAEIGQQLARARADHQALAETVAAERAAHAAALEQATAAVAEAHNAQRRAEGKVELLVEQHTARAANAAAELARYERLVTSVVSGRDTLAAVLAEHQPGLDDRARAEAITTTQLVHRALTAYLTGPAEIGGDATTDTAAGVGPRTPSTPEPAAPGPAAPRPAAPGAAAPGAAGRRHVGLVGAPAGTLAERDLQAMLDRVARGEVTVATVTVDGQQVQVWVINNVEATAPGANTLNHLLAAGRIAPAPAQAGSSVRAVTVTAAAGGGAVRARRARGDAAPPPDRAGAHTHHGGPGASGAVVSDTGKAAAGRRRGGRPTR